MLSVSDEGERGAAATQLQNRQAAPEPTEAPVRARFVCRSPRCGCRRPRSAHARRRRPVRPPDWAGRILAALAYRPSTRAVLAARPARTRLPGFGDRPLDPDFLTALTDLLRARPVRWIYPPRPKRVPRWEVSR